MINYLAEFRALLDTLDASAGNDSRRAAELYCRTLFKLEMLSCQALFVQEAQQPGNSTIDWSVIADGLRLIRKNCRANAGFDIAALQSRLHDFIAEQNSTKQTAA